MKQLPSSILICFFLILFTDFTHAHKASDSYLRLKIEKQTIDGQWDIALRDLDYAVGLDGNHDGQITWGELRERHQGIATYALSRLQVKTDDSQCWSHPTEHLVDHHTDGAYSVLRFSVVCPQPVTQLKIDYSLLFDVDSLHHGLLQVQNNGLVQTGVLSPAQRIIEFDVQQRSPWQEFLQFGQEGVWHIWIGYDHILFLLSLLLPAVLWWKKGRWYGQQAFRPALREVLKIVTAFTLAHSFTLSLAVLEIVTLPSRWVEATIAASVLVAALHNLYPIFRTRLWVMTFVFGLVHGLGFASVLVDLGLPGQFLALALAGFNIGVEIGQLVIVVMVIPLAFLIRHTWSYQRLVLNFGSIMIALFGFVWLIERSMDINIIQGMW